MHVPEHLEDLARRIRAAGAPTDFLESSIVEHVSRELGRKHAGEHAAAFVEALNETPGAPRARLWAKADRADVRVYFAGDLGYVSVGWDGSISGASIVPGRRSQSLTFSPDSLYPAQRRAYRQALEDYRAGLIERSEEHAQERVEKIAELRENEVILRVEDGRIRFARSAIQGILKSKGDKSEGKNDGRAEASVEPKLAATAGAR